MGYIFVGAGLVCKRKRKIFFHDFLRFEGRYFSRFFTILASNLESAAAHSILQETPKRPCNRKDLQRLCKKYPPFDKDHRNWPRSNPGKAGTTTPGASLEPCGERSPKRRSKTPISTPPLAAICAGKQAAECFPFKLSYARSSLAQDTGTGDR